MVQRIEPASQLKAEGAEIERGGWRSVHLLYHYKKLQH